MTPDQLSDAIGRYVALADELEAYINEAEPDMSDDDFVEVRERLAHAGSVMELWRQTGQTDLSIVHAAVVDAIEQLELAKRMLKAADAARSESRPIQA